MTTSVSSSVWPGATTGSGGRLHSSLPLTGSVAPSETAPVTLSSMRWWNSLVEMTRETPPVNVSASRAARYIGSAGEGRMWEACSPPPSSAVARQMNSSDPGSLITTSRATRATARPASTRTGRGEGAAQSAQSIPVMRLSAMSASGRPAMRLRRPLGLGPLGGGPEGATSESRPGGDSIAQRVM